MLKSLILHNWKSHKHNEINFSQGYNVFVGNIGSGKTSIFDAIVFSLFGTTPNITSRKIPVKDLIMSKPVEEEEATITLTFELDKEEYKIERILHRTKSSQAKIYKNNNLIRGPKPSDVNDEVEKLLGISLDAFMKANYAEQNSIDYFLRLPANERKALFDNLFDISFYDDIAINSRQVNNKLKTKYEELAQKTSEYKKLLENYNVNEIKEKLDNIQKEILQINNELNNTNKIINEQKAKELEITKQKLEYETKTNLINNLLGKEKYLDGELQKLKETLKENKSELEDKLTKIKTDKEQLSKDKINLEQEYNNLRSKTLFYNNKLSDLNTKQNEFTKLSEQLKDIPKDINDIVNKLVTLIEDAKERITKNDTLSKTLEQDIITLEKSTANCPLCTQELTHEHKEDILQNKMQNKKEIESKILNDKEEYMKYKQDYEIKNKQREFYNRNIELFEKNKIELSEIENIKKLLLDNTEQEKLIKEKLNNQNNEIQTRDNTIKELEQKIKQFLDFDTKQKDLDKVKTDLKETKVILENIKYNPEEYTKIKENLQKILTEQQYKKQIVLEKEKQSKEEKFKFEQFELLLKNKDSSEKECNLLNKYIEDFNVFGQVSKKTQEQVRSYVIESINLVFQDLWQHIYPYKDFNSIKFNADNGDYKIELYFNNEYKRELDEFISGGERSSIALALRIAMCLVMKNKLNLIILDEPTHNLDEKSVLALSDLFNNYLPQFVDQTFVITHDSNLEQYAKNVYYISRNKETDGATEVNIK